MSKLNIKAGCSPYQSEICLFQLNIDTYATDGVLDKIKQERGYSYEDELLCSEDQKDFEEKIKAFFTEHLHADEEIRYS